jgi:hypothetical protein
MNGAQAQENRLRAFAAFFKGYMGVMPLLTAAVAPLLTMMNAIPVFASQKKTLATYSGLLGFLLIAWVFYVRRAFALNVSFGKSTGFFRISRLVADLFPLLLILGSVYCYITYFSTLHLSIGLINSTIDSLHGSRQYLLDNWKQAEQIPQEGLLQLYYLGIFLFAEAAFVVMALREYVYGVLNVSEREVLGGGGVALAPRTTPAPSDDTPPQ